MMECKKALTEADGDLAKAEEILRVKLGNKASKAATRVAAEGLVGLFIVSDSQARQPFSKSTAKPISSPRTTISSVSSMIGRTGRRQESRPTSPRWPNCPGRGHGRSSVRPALVGKIGENISIRRFHPLRNQQSSWRSYVHGGKIGVLVDYSGPDEAWAKTWRCTLPQPSPRRWTPAAFRQADIAAERSVAEQKAAESGKPAEIVAKMVEGSVQKFLKEVTLAVPAVRQGRQAVGRADAQGKGREHRSSFALYVVGEGIEKKSERFRRRSRSRRSRRRLIPIK